MVERVTTGRERGPSEGLDPPSALPGLVAVTLFLMGIWLAFSNKMDVFHLACGVISALVVAKLTEPLMFVGVRRTATGRRVRYYVWSFRWHRLVVFVPWLLWKIAAANLQVARMVISPRRPIDPDIIELDTGLQSDVARLALAATITLTPGTCVLDVRGDRFVVHKLHPSSADDLVSGRMVERVRETFELEGIEPRFDPVGEGEPNRA